jgi:RNA polymerase sigma factor (sigma-70 family)
MCLPRHEPEFDHVFRELMPRAKRVAYRILDDVADAEDAAVEALARAATKWSHIRTLPPASRNAWIFRVTSTVAHDELRRRIRRRRWLPVEPFVDGQDPLHAIDLRFSMVAHLARLPTRQRQVLTLRYIGGLSEAEIARSLGVSAGTVKTSASRGLMALRTNLRLEPEFDRWAGSTLPEAALPDSA